LWFLAVDIFHVPTWRTFKKSKSRKAAKAQRKDLNTLILFVANSSFLDEPKGNGS
jgi:hypothetical protein